MIEVKFAAANRAALNALIADYIGTSAATVPVVDAKPAVGQENPAQHTGKPNKPEVEAPASAPAPAAEKPAAAATSEAAAPAVVTYDQIAAAVPKTAGLGPNAAAKVKALMVKWGVVPPKKVKDAVPADQYGAFLTELLAITND